MPAHPRRHVRLGQPLAVLGQADAGVEQVDDELVVLVLELQVDAVAGKTVFAAITPAFQWLRRHF